jgi:anti-sigma factor (TIGR02949 family)
MTAIGRLSCEEVMRRLADYVDRELSPRERAMVEEHLRTCEACAREHRFEQALVDETRAKLRRVAVPGDLIARVRRALELSAGAAEPESG